MLRGGTQRRALYFIADSEHILIKLLIPQVWIKPRTVAFTVRDRVADDCL